MTLFSDIFNYIQLKDRIDVYDFYSISVEIKPFQCRSC
jgi:hypothetical protein